MPWGICFFNKILSVSASSVLLGVTEFVHMSGICHHSLMYTPVGHSGGFLGFVLMNDIAANILLPSPQGCSSEHIPESRAAASQGCVYSIAGHGQSSSKCWHQFSSHQQSGRVLVLHILTNVWYGHILNLWWGIWWKMVPTTLNTPVCPVSLPS